MAQAVVLSGGEPLFHPSINQVVHHAQGLGLYVVLSTSGRVDVALVHELASVLDWLALPLDSMNERVAAQLRPGCGRHHDATIQIIHDLRCSPRTPKIKLGTVITALNATEITGLVRAVPASALPDVWKFYEVLYIGRNLASRRLLGLPHYRFVDIVSAATGYLSACGVKVVSYTASGADRKHFLIDPGGVCYVIQNGVSVSLGSILSDTDTVLARALAVADFEAIRESFLATYPREHLPAPAGGGGAQTCQK
jgi:MoaA/NifB/PqqE/SkfB family radical SAM enzyme